MDAGGELEVALTPATTTSTATTTTTANVIDGMVSSRQRTSSAKNQPKIADMKKNCYSIGSELSFFIILLSLLHHYSFLLINLIHSNAII